MFGAFRDFRRLGLLGMNARNVDYILPHNPRRNFPLVDDKLRTKELAEAAGIATPMVYETIRFASDTAGFFDRMATRPEFVVKPAKGSGGGGIVVIGGRTTTGFRRASGRALPAADMRYHLTNILSGLYSLGGQPDVALIQYRVRADPFFDALAIAGVPDVRVIVYRGVPVMAMLRLPTHESDGRANLHAGGIGVGVALSSGVMTHGVYRNQSITEHPDTGMLIAGHIIPHWTEILHMAAPFCDLTGLGYLGVDIVIDATHGPMMLEVNARPGIAIQTANRAGLRTRLEQVDREIGGLRTVEDKVAFAQRCFA